MTLEKLSQIGNPIRFRLDYTRLDQFFNWIEDDKETMKKILPRLEAAIVSKEGYPV